MNFLRQILYQVEPIKAFHSHVFNKSYKKINTFSQFISLQNFCKFGTNAQIVPVHVCAKNHGSKIAIIDEFGNHTYDKILGKAINLGEQIFSVQNKKSNSNYREGSNTIAFLCGNNVSYVIVQWAVWNSGCICVPLCPSHPIQEIDYFISNSNAKLLIYEEEFKSKLQPLLEKGNLDFIELSSQVTLHKEPFMNVETQNAKNEIYYHDQKALIIYTSGTTGKPKGVVHTFGSLHAQMDGMIKAWLWKNTDVILHVLPLHHVHGIVNALMTPLYVGATCVMLPKFDAGKVWKYLTETKICNVDLSVNLFMAVPTIYAKLIEHVEENNNKKNEASIPQKSKEICIKQIRLMVSGSSALPEPIMLKWKQLTGHQLLERYGMTEIGMALTNPLSGSRLPGFVGNPFPLVEVRIVKQYSNGCEKIVAEGTSHGTSVTPGWEEEEGELQVRGPNLFFEYWNNEVSTKNSFTDDGWFKTGDTVIYRNGAYKIQGRTSVDIIKSGGYKISALDVERELLSHEYIKDVAVVGIPDPTWGERVACVVISKEDKTLTLDELKHFCCDKLAPYQIPSVLKQIPEMPRNVMGKVNKKVLVKTIFSNCDDLQET